MATGSPAPDRRGARERAKEASREALLRAGLELFAAEGLDAPSLDAVCARAGYTRGAFYVHFRDREDFLEAVLGRVLEGYVATIVRTGSPGDLAATVQRFLEAFAEDAQADPLSPAGGALHLRLLLDGCRRSEAVRARFVSGFELAAAALEGVIEGGQGAGAVRADLSPPATARLLVTLVLGLLAVRQTGVPYDGAAGVAELARLLAPAAPPGDPAPAGPGSPRPS